MNNVAGLSVFALGVVLLILGLGEVRLVPISFLLEAGSASFWMTVLGVITVGIGLWLALKGSAPN